MLVEELVDKLGMKVLTAEEGLEREISGVYACDLLSWVMANASKGHAWITVHTHLNIVAVAVLNELACVIIPDHIRVEEATLQKAKAEGVTLLSSGMQTYEICWRIHENEICR